MLQKLYVLFTGDTGSASEAGLYYFSMNHYLLAFWFKSCLFEHDCIHTTSFEKHVCYSGVLFLEVYYVILHNINWYVSPEMAVWKPGIFTVISLIRDVIKHEIISLGWASVAMKIHKERGEGHQSVKLNNNVTWNLVAINGLHP